MNIEYIIDKIDQLSNKMRQHSAIQIYDNSKANIEICLGVLEFEENKIKLELAKMNVIITGFDLKLRNYNKNGIEINGRIHSIDFEEK